MWRVTSYSLATLTLSPTRGSVKKKKKKKKKLRSRRAPKALLRERPYACGERATP